jgi:threonine dehydrogenase-like Zn-dependent dehydrogenase
MFRGHEPAGSGFIMGHEFTGTVVAADKDVQTVKIGDKVVAPFTISWYDIVHSASKHMHNSETGALGLIFAV